MKTVIALATPEAIACAAEIIRAGGLVAFPTETVYGLGANALDPAAVARIYEAKQRVLNDPLIVHVAGPTVLSRLASATALARPAAGPTIWPDKTGLDAQGTLDELDLSAHLLIRALHESGVIGGLDTAQAAYAETLTARYWPGPLTLVLPRGTQVPANVSAGLDTVAVRMPDHPVAQALIQHAHLPIAAPSANLFGHVSPTTAQHVLDDLDGRIDMLLDDGPTRIGVESTVLDLTSNPPRVLRPGGITREALEQCLQLDLASEAATDANEPVKLASPGMLEKHYAPNAQLIVCQDIDALLRRRSALALAHTPVGILIRESERAVCRDMHPQFVLGDTLDDIARALYAGLRTLDSAGVNTILITQMPRAGLGAAIADRLRRAAAKNPEPRGPHES